MSFNPCLTSKNGHSECLLESHWISQAFAASCGLSAARRLGFGRVEDGSRTRFFARSKWAREYGVGVKSLEVLALSPPDTNVVIIC